MILLWTCGYDGVVGEGIIWVDSVEAGKAEDFNAAQKQGRCNPQIITDFPCSSEFYTSSSRENAASGGAGKTGVSGPG